MKWNGIGGRTSYLGHVDNEGTSALHLAVQNSKMRVTSHMYIPYENKLSRKNAYVFAH